MSKPIEALAEEFLLQLENNEAFQKVVVLPYAGYANGALQEAKREALKPAGECNPQIVVDALRKHVIYNEISTIVQSNLGDLRRARTARDAKEKAGPGGQKDLQPGEESA